MKKVDKTKPSKRRNMSALVLIGLITKVNLIRNDVLESIKSRKLRFRFAKYICC